MIPLTVYMTFLLWHEKAERIPGRLHGVGLVHTRHEALGIRT